MLLEELKRAKGTRVAGMASAIAVAAKMSLAGDCLGHDWMFNEGDAAEPELELRFLAQIFVFVWENPGAPAEALFRKAAALGIHSLPADAWACADIPTGMRFAYEMFTAAVPLCAGMIDADIARLDRIEMAANAGPVLASALSLPVEETTLEMVPDPLETRAGYALTVIEPTPEPAPAQADAVPTPAKRKR